MAGELNGKFALVTEEPRLAVLRFDEATPVSPRTSKMQPGVSCVRYVKAREAEFVKILPCCNNTAMHSDFFRIRLPTVESFDILASVRNERGWRSELAGIRPETRHALSDENGQRAVSAAAIIQVWIMTLYPRRS